MNRIEIEILKRAITEREVVAIENAIDHWNLAKECLTSVFDEWASPRLIDELANDTLSVPHSLFGFEETECDQVLSVFHLNEIEKKIKDAGETNPPWKEIFDVIDSLRFLLEKKK